MRNVNYKVSFEYSIDNLKNKKNETGTLSETKMSRENVIRTLIMMSPLTYKDNLKNLSKLNRKNEFMIVTLGDRNESQECLRIMKITR